MVRVDGEYSIPTAGNISERQPLLKLEYIIDKIAEN